MVSCSSVITKIAFKVHLGISETGKPGKGDQQIWIGAKSTGVFDEEEGTEKYINIDGTKVLFVLKNIGLSV